jgi:hypothetical protein
MVVSIPAGTTLSAVTDPALRAAIARQMPGHGFDGNGLQMIRGDFVPNGNFTAHMSLHAALLMKLGIDHYALQDAQVRARAPSVQFAGGYDLQDNFGRGNHDKSLYNVKEFRERNDTGAFLGCNGMAERAKTKANYTGTGEDLCSDDNLKIAQQLKTGAVDLTPPRVLGREGSTNRP